MTTQAQISEARKKSDPKILLSDNQYAKSLGITLSIDNEELIGKLTFDQHLIGDLGAATLHCGSIAALLETTAICTLRWQIEDIETPTVVNTSTEFICPARPLISYAHAVITRQSKQVATVLCVLWQTDRESPIATSAHHFSLTTRR